MFFKNKRKYGPYFLYNKYVEKISDFCKKKHGNLKYKFY